MLSTRLAGSEPSAGAMASTVHRRRQVQSPAKALEAHSSTRAVSAAATCLSDVTRQLGLGEVVEERFQGGSLWSSTYVLKTSEGRRLFAKTARGRSEEMFRGEALGLQALRGAGSGLQVPEVLQVGHLEGPGRGSYILMEYLELNSGGARLDQAELGRRLARMHLATPTDPNAAAGLFGFPVDNTIGGTHQPNKWSDDWVEFVRTQRLGHMLQLAGDAQLSRLGVRLLPRLERLFDGLEVRPSVLHGDLWSGNMGAAQGQPAIFDPATHYGHHESEFGMAWCAGFSPAFWKAYHEVIPRAPGFEKRHQLYQLYHYLNHYVLFGGGYYGTCQRLLTDLVAAVEA